MHATSFLVLPLSVLGLLAPAVQAAKCQLFVTAPTGTSLTGTTPGFGEVTRECAVSPLGNPGSSQNTDACSELGNLKENEFNTDESIFVRPTALSEAVEVRIFRDDLSEGFMKFAGQDLNFEGECEDVGSEVKPVKRCEFEC